MLSLKIKGENIIQFTISQMVKKYRPSNGTEGDVFMEQFCERCQEDDIENDKMCNIIALTMAYDIRDAKYPVEWVYGEEGKPTCTKFKERI